MPLSLFGVTVRAAGSPGLAGVMVDGCAVVAWFRRGEDGSRGAAPAGRRAIIPARRTCRTGTRGRTTLTLRSPGLPRDREDFSYREGFPIV
jgi:hypothetical protein